MNQTPAAQGYRMPAEWEPHAATLLTWPHDERHWPGRYAHIAGVWARMVKELEVGEDVHILIHDDETEVIAKAEMKKAKVQGDRVHLHRIRSNFSWARDHGPIVVKNPAGKRLFLDWLFNGWGNQWEHDLDDHVASLFARELGESSLSVRMVLEGGSIDVNGQGALLTTENCLLNPNRNPGFTKEKIEEFLKNYLGVTKILWLGEGIMGDDTSGHIDDLTRFVGSSTVATVVSENESDPDFAPLNENLERLKTMTDQNGMALEVLTMNQPTPVFIDGQRIPASYANFYIGNECVLLPIWNDPNDAAAIDTLRRCFPTRRIVPIDSRELTWGFGSFHCVTQQIPL